MCLAVPGQVLEVVDERLTLARVDIAGVRRSVNVGLLQGDDARWRFELIGEVENVADTRGPERVNRLSIVTDHGHPAAILEHVAHRGRPARQAGQMSAHLGSKSESGFRVSQ